ncbi:baseplate J/gp47 family protein [Helicobacter sp. L8]|uniref:baseplate J/gp47 family protein n=1 Tax=Helicobacter sp. L8 TaxID=2316078 RepID=UPI000EAC5320|nr:baseplate J/gp47 family protein [Helicobacter sp. L8]
MITMPTFLTPLDFESARAELTTHFAQAYKERTGRDYAPLISDDIQCLISSVLYYLGKQIDKINYTHANNYLEYSSGAYLDALVKLLGLERRQQEMPTARLKITTKTALFLPKNTKFASMDGAVAYSLVDSNLPKGESVIQVVGDKEGDWQTTILENANPLILNIEVLSPFVNMQDYEDDDALKKRYLSALASFSTAGSVLSYTHFANVKGVGKIKVESLNAGEVTIYYSADNLDAPKLIRDNLEKHTPLTDKVFIEQAIKRPISLEYAICLHDNLEQKEIIEAIKTRAFSLFKRLEIGQGVSVSKLASLAFVDKAVKDCVVNALDPVERNEWLFLEGVQVSIREQL